MPFPEDFSADPLVIGRDHYADAHNPMAEWTSIISATLTVPTSEKTLAQLLLAAETTETDEVLGTSATATLEYSGTVAPHPYMKIVAGTFDITFIRAAGDVVLLDQGDGTLVVGSDVGTIDYETGEWTITLDSAPDDSEQIDATYDWSFVVPSTVTIRSLWMVPGAADEIYATYSEDGVPTASTGLLLSEGVFLSNQPELIANAKFLGNDTALDVEVMI